MHVTVRRIAAAFIIALIIEGAAFAIHFDDLLYLRQPPEAIVTAGVELFERHASDALRRRTLTIRHLETIAAAAREFGRYDLEVLALERREGQGQPDPALQLRLADALRRAGRLDLAERRYLALINAVEREDP